MPSAEVLLEHAEFLRRLARGILHDADAADDVAQDAMVAALGERPKNLRAWLGKVARHLALTHRRAEARRERREHEAARREALPSAAEGVARLELQRRVVDAVLALDEPYRSVVVHRFFYDLGPVEIAKRLDVPVETVRTRLRRALDRLRERLDESHGRRAWSVALLAIAVPRKAPLGGILAMSAKTKLVAASVLLLACAAIGVSVIGRRDAPASRAPVREEARVEPEAATPPPVVAAAPVDFAAIDRDRDVHGVVVDPAGNPVAGADVRVVRYPAMGMAGMLAQAEAEEGPETRTASDGTFALRVERGEEVDLRVKANGFVPVQRRWCPAGGKLRIAVIREGVRIRVRAVGPDGVPLAGVHVLDFKSGPEFEVEISSLYLVVGGVTDERGICVFADLLPGRQTMLFGWHPDLHIPRPVPVQLPDAGEVEVQLSAVRARDLTGRVIDAATGEPVVGAMLVALAAPVPIAKHVLSGPDGTYRYGGWSSDGVGEDLYVHADGYASARETVGDRTQVDFALQRGRTLAGVVRDCRGDPVAAAYIAAEARGPDNRQEAFVYARSDTAGRFELRDLRPDLPQILIVTKPGFPRVEMSMNDAHVVPGPVPFVEITLPDPRRLEGRVLGLDGEPLEGLLVEMNAVPRAPRKVERHTDDLGRFRFADLPSGRYSVSVAKADGARLERTVEIGDADVSDVDLRFKRGRAFTAQVVDDAGRPLAGIPLLCYGVKRTTDAEGRAVFEVPRGQATAQVAIGKLEKLIASAPWAPYRPGQGEPRIVLHEAVPVSGRVVVDGQPLAWACLWIRGPDGFSDSFIAKKEGEFSTRVPAGTRVTIGLTGQVMNDMQPIYGELKDVAAGTKGLVLEGRRVPLDRTLIVRVVTPDGTGVENIQISLDARGWKGWDPKKPPTTDAQGRVELSGLPAAEFEVSLSFSSPPVPWARPKLLRVMVFPNGQEVVFTLRESKPIRGVVRLPEGSGTAAVYAWPSRLDPGKARIWDDRLAHAISASDGTFVLYIPADERDPVLLEVMAGEAYAEVAGVAPGTEGVVIDLRSE